MTEDDSVNAGVADGPANASMANAASADTTLVRMAAARAEATRAFPLPLLSLFDMQREEAGRKLAPGVVNAVDDPRDRAAAMRKREDFMVN